MPYGREDEYTGMEAEEWEILSQNMPNASDEERSQAFQEYKKEKHFADREGEPFGIYDFLQGMGIDTNQNLPPEVQGRMQMGRQPGRQELPLETDALPVERQTLPFDPALGQPKRELL